MARKHLDETYTKRVTGLISMESSLSHILFVVFVVGLMYFSPFKSIHHPAVLICSVLGSHRKLYQDLALSFMLHYKWFTLQDLLESM